MKGDRAEYHGAAAQRHGKRTSGAATLLLPAYEPTAVRSFDISPIDFRRVFPKAPEGTRKIIEGRPRPNAHSIQT